MALVMILVVMGELFVIIMVYIFNDFSLVMSLEEFGCGGLFSVMKLVNFSLLVVLVVIVNMW